MSEKKKFCFFVTCLYLAVAFAEQLEATTNIVEVATKHGNNLKNGSIFSCCNESLNKSNPTIYCYHGNELKLSITTAEAVISLRHDDFSLFWGKNNQEVLKKFRDKKPVFKFYIFDLSKFRINIDPHKKTCFGIVSSKNYTLNVTEKLEMPDYPMIYQLGMWLFLYCRNEVMSVYEYYYFATWIIFIPLMLYVSLSLTPDPHQNDMGNAFLKFHPIFLYWHKLLWDDLSEFIIEYGLIKHIIICLAIISFNIVNHVIPPAYHRMVIIKRIIMVLAIVIMLYSAHNLLIIALVLIFFASLWVMEIIDA